MPLIHATDTCMNSDRARTRRSGVPTATHDARHRPAHPSFLTHSCSGGLNREVQPQVDRKHKQKTLFEEICNFGFNQTPAGGQNLPYKVVFFLS